MSKLPDPLRGIRVAAPCPTTWEGMAGDERVRHCSLCSLNVYNFAEMTRAEISELLMRTEGRVCGRLYRRADNTVLTKDCPSRLQVIRRRVSGLGASVLAALIGISAFSFGCASGKARLGKQGSRVKLKVEHVAMSQKAAFEGMVGDETGAPLPGVVVVIRDAVTQREAITGVDGTFAIPSLPAGTYRVEITLSGLQPAVLEKVRLQSDEVTRARVALRMDLDMTVTVGIIAVDPVMSDSNTTTFSRDFLDKVPHGN